MKSSVTIDNYSKGNAFKESFAWFVSNSLFGGLVLAITFLMSCLDTDIVVNGQLILEQGILLFMSVSLVGAVLVDYAMCKKQKHGIIQLVIIILPMSILIISSVLYSNLNFSPKTTTSIEGIENLSYDFLTLNVLQYIIMASSFLYCISLKYYIIVYELELKTSSEAKILKLEEENARFKGTM
ncbi:MAG: hypothetical protein ACRBFS_07925 [Aureispira sp.]